MREREKPARLLERRSFLEQVTGLALGGALFGCRALPGPEGTVQASEPATPIEPPAVPPEPRPADAAADALARVDLEPTPDFSPERLKGYVAGLRPYRRGSVRIELEHFAGRPLVHNYGHGGAGITLAPGSALEVLDLLKPHLPDVASVAVLGGGVNGMAVATLLVSAGYSVSVYAREFSPNTTSNVAGGQFAPSLVGTGRNSIERGLFDRLVRRSYAAYQSQIGAGFGVLPKLNYATNNAGSGLRRLPADMIPPVREFERLPFAGGERPGRAYETLLIEPPIYLARLASDLRRAGVLFEERAFEHQGELSELSADAIVNCLGLGAGSLFGDAAVLPIRGQLVLLEPQELPYLLSHSGYLFPRSDAVVLGGTAERNATSLEPDPYRCQRILRNNASFFGVSA